MTICMERDVKTAKEENTMSALLHAVRSFDRNCRHIRPSEESDMPPSGRPIALLRDFHAPESEAKSNPFGGLLRAKALLETRTLWQVRATALITLFRPPPASLILLAVYYFEN